MNEKDRQANYRETHRELLREKQRVYQQAHKQAISQQRQAHREAHNGEMRAKEANYREKHREELRTATAAYESKKKHPCPDCGKLIYHKAIRCRSCATKVYQAKIPKVPETVRRQHEQELAQKRRIKQMHPCPECGAMVHKHSVRCIQCAAKAIWADPAYQAKRKATFPRGERSPNWKGGRYIVTRKGRQTSYVMVLQPDHPRASDWGYVFEHILVWEAAHGKPLPKGWIVHHLNGIGTDNRPANLVGLPNHSHHLILQAKGRRIQELEAMLKAQGMLL